MKIQHFTLHFIHLPLGGEGMKIEVWAMIEKMQEFAEEW